MPVDPVQVLGFVGAWCALVLVLWVIVEAASHVYAWRARRQIRRARARRRELRLVPPPVDDGFEAEIEWRPPWGSRGT